MCDPSEVREASSGRRPADASGQPAIFRVRRSVWLKPPYMVPSGAGNATMRPSDARLWARAGFCVDIESGENSNPKRERGSSLPISAVVIRFECSLMIMMIVCRLLPRSRFELR